MEITKGYIITKIFILVYIFLINGIDGNSATDKGLKNHKVIKEHTNLEMDCKAPSFGGHPPDNHTDIAWKWIPSTNNDTRGKIVASIGEQGINKDENIECKICYVTKTHGELSVRLMNVTLAQKGIYQCTVMGKGIYSVHVDITIAPLINCSLADGLNDKNESKSLVKCQIECTNLEPEVEIIGNYETVSNSTQSCTGEKEGMKRYELVYQIKSKLNITIFGMGYKYEKLFNDPYIRPMYFIDYLFIIVPLVWTVGALFYIFCFDAYIDRWVDKVMVKKE